MLQLVGDLHGDFYGLPKEGTILQVGDFGFWPERKSAWNKYRKHSKAKVYFIDGNHEYHVDLPHNATEIVEVWEELWYIPRGLVVELEGYTIGCLGGGRSPDENWRKVGVDLFPQEVVTAEQTRRLALQGKGIDLLVTHVPPRGIIDEHFERKGFLKFFGLPDTWQDPSTLFVQELRDFFPKVPLFCGHMHRSLTDGDTRLLNIGEVCKIG